MPRSILFKTLFAGAIALAAALPAKAQSTLENPEQRIRDAFATPYADTLLKTFVTSVRTKADAACLQEKAFDDATIAARGSAILQRYAIQMQKVIDDAVDRDTFQKRFTEIAGPRAVSELDRLKRDRDVQKLIALSRPADLAQTVTVVVENFDHYLMIGRINLYQISPAGRGQEEPKENPTEASNAAVQKFLDTTPAKKKINRYLDLLEAESDARKKAVPLEVALKIGPMSYFAGADRDLAELCIGKIQQSAR